MTLGIPDPGFGVRDSGVAECGFAERYHLGLPRVRELLRGAAAGHLCAALGHAGQHRRHRFRHVLGNILKLLCSPRGTTTATATATETGKLVQHGLPLVRCVRDLIEVLVHGQKVLHHRFDRCRTIHCRREDEIVQGRS